MYIVPTSLVRVKTKYQVTLPHAIQKAAKLSVGDLLEVTIKKDKITLAPKRIVDKNKAFIDAHIAEGLKDIAEGRTYGPFDTAEEMIQSLHAQVRRIRAERKKQKLSPKSR